MVQRLSGREARSSRIPGGETGHGDIRSHSQAVQLTTNVTHPTYNAFAEGRLNQTKESLAKVPSTVRQVAARCRSDIWETANRAAPPDRPKHAV